MQADTGVSPIADVRVSEHLDYVVVTARDRLKSSVVAASLRKSLPDAVLRRSAGGVRVSSEDSGALLETLTSIDLRWRPEALRFVENRQRVRRAHNSIHEEVQKLLKSDRKTAERYICDVHDLDCTR